MNLQGRISRLERILQANRSRLKEPKLIVTVTDFCSGEHRIIFPPERAGERYNGNESERQAYRFRA